MVMKKLIKNIYQDFIDYDILIYSGNATLYIIMAAIPFLVMVISIVNLTHIVSIDVVTDYIYQFIPELDILHNQLVNIMSTINQQSTSLLASVAAITMLWSGSSGITALQKGLKKIDDVPYSMVKDRPRAILFTILFMITLLQSIIFSLFGNLLTNVIIELITKLNIDILTTTVTEVFTVSSFVTYLIIFIFITLTYTFLPHAKRKIKNQYKGAIFATIGWFLLSKIFAFIMENIWQGSALYGSLTSMYLLALWLIFNIMIFFIGALVNKHLNSK